MLTEETRKLAAQKLRESAQLMEDGDVLGSGRTLLAGLPPVIRELKTTYGPLIEFAVRAKWNELFGGK